MTKEEFLSIISTELEKLEKEKKLAQNRIDYYKEVSSGGKELQDAIRQLEAINSKIDALRRFVNLPAYARIQAASSIELEEYKKEKIEELELRIKEIEAQEIQEREQLSQLKAVQSANIERFARLSGDEREQAISEGKNLSNKIGRFDAVFEEIRRKIEELKTQQEKIKSKNVEEIRQELLLRTPNAGSLKHWVENAKKSPLSYQDKLYAAVANDPEKRQKMVDLLTRVGYIERVIDSIQIPFGMSYGIPLELQKIIKNGRYYTSNSLINPEGLEETIENYLKQFSEKRKMYEEEFTLVKLAPLIGKENGNESDVVDFDFLQFHENKIGKGKLEELRYLVEQRDKLTKKIIKTRSTKDDIYNLSNKIREVQSIIYKEIIGWYNSQSLDVLGIDNRISYALSIFGGLDNLKDTLERGKTQVNNSAKAIDDLKNGIREAQEKFKQQLKSFEEQRADIARQMIELSGIEAQKDFVPTASSSEEQRKHLEDIRRADVRSLEGQIIERVQQEAQNQADTKEAELRNITVEQLLELRKQALSAQQPEIQTVKEESQGMKM